MTNTTKPSDVPPLTRRNFLRGLLAVGVGTGTLTAFTYSRQQARLSVDEISLEIPGLAAHLDGKRLAQLSDIHLSEHTGPELFAEAIAQVTAIGAEWLVLTGDLVGGEALHATGLIEPLTTLNIPVLAVLGNHDYGTDRSTVVRNLQAGRAQVLVNEAVDLGGNLWIAGLDSVWSGRPSLQSALQSVPPHAATILLVHEPDYFDTVIEEDAPIRVQLSGHSHGGQIRLPAVQTDASGYRTYAPVLPPLGERYPIGLRTIGQRSVYTNRGLGGWPIPTRFNCPPELTIFTLHSV